MAAGYASRFGARDWGRLAGLWHDLGKSSDEFQAYLRASSAQGKGSRPKGPDHKTAGAQHAVSQDTVLGHLLAYAINGHHGGLPDGRSDGTCLESSLAKEVPPWQSDFKATPATRGLTPPAHLGEALGQRDGFGTAFFTRMLFSCLVDADFLDTERFKDARRADSRPDWPADILPRMEAALTDYVGAFSPSQALVDRERCLVREACLSAATEEPGLFSLTVPTGGGKTLSSLAFAIRHAITHGLDRVIYVVPFTSIIEQNVDVFRKAMSSVSKTLGSDVVLEHHSNLASPGNETVSSRLATENWDAPLIVTTSVQFYESLFHNKTSRCRKLHRIAGSVVILDEVQTLPVHLLHPCLRALHELTRGYGSSVVLCTATQPALLHRGDFQIGLKGVREIIPDPTRLSTNLKRVHVKDIGPQENGELVARMREAEQVLCIVSTRHHAKEIFDGLGPEEGHYHLSALMVPEHRSEVLRELRARLDRNDRCRVVTTQLIEAGVDIDFPVVYRALAGLDSIAQAAGRCNRNGRLQEGGRTFVFQSPNPRPERFLKDTQSAARQVLALHDDVLSLKAIEHYFKLYYWDQSSRWDEKRILDRFHLDGHNMDFPFLLDFATCARDFQLIEETGRAVIVPWKSEGERLCESLRATGPLPPRDVLQRLQRFSVQVPLRTWEKHLGRGIELVHDRYPVLTSTEVHYVDSTGLNLDDPPIRSLVI